MAVINTNIMTMNAQRNLSRSQSDLSEAVQRLSSGLRINSAKDDAAGLAIASRMGVQISGLSVAVRNANDGISIAQTAEGAMDEMVGALTRANDLAIQAASYNTAGDRASLNNEVSQLIDEMSRIVNQTRYNGETILSGGFSADVQVGVQVNESINVSIGNLSPAGLGVSSEFQDVNALSDADFADRIRTNFATDLDAADEIQGSGVSTAIGTTIAANSNSVNKIDAINAISAQTGVSAFSLGNAAVGTAAADNAGTAGAGEVTINGVQIAASTDVATLVTNINAVSGQTGVTADAPTPGTDTLVLFNRTGAAISVNVTGADAATLTGFAQGTTNVDAGANGAIVLNDQLNSNTITFSDASANEAVTGTSATTSTVSNVAVSGQTVNTAGEANLALLAFSSAIDQVNEDRAVLGAKLNRLESTIRNVENVRENISAAQSRIQDADFAKETAKLTRAQILQQAGTAMVAQANQIPQSVLSLLQ